MQYQREKDIAQTLGDMSRVEKKRVKGPVDKASLRMMVEHSHQEGEKSDYEMKNSWISAGLPSRRTRLRGRKRGRGKRRKTRSERKNPVLHDSHQKGEKMIMIVKPFWESTVSNASSTSRAGVDMNEVPRNSPKVSM